MWGPIIGAGISAIGSLAGGALSSAGSAANNAQNLQMAREQMQFSAAQAKAQMDFQERMSNTQYQRGMADMKSAGLNPILAYQQGGASSPSGAQGQSAGASFENTMQGIGQGVTSASKGAERLVELNQVKSSTDKNVTAAALDKANVDTQATVQAMNNQTTATSAAQAAKANAETANVIASADNPAAMKAMYESISNQNNSAAALAQRELADRKLTGDSTLGRNLGSIHRIGQNVLDAFRKHQADPTTYKPGWADWPMRMLGGPANKSLEIDIRK